MDIPGIILELSLQKQRIEEAIHVLEQLSRSRPKRRGRPPGRSRKLPWRADLEIQPNDSMAAS